MPDVEQTTTARIPTPHGEFNLCLYDDIGDDKEHMALVMGDIAGEERVLVRIHSECFTGDVLGSQRCDCGEQLDRAMQIIAQEGAGVILYLRQEGRGIGLADKLRAYNLQDAGYDTVEANWELGHSADERDYTIAVRILKNLGIRSVQLLTNNPTKISSLRDLGMSVADRVPLEVSVNSENAGYLLTKAQRMNHLLDVDTLTSVNGNGGRPNGPGVQTYQRRIERTLAGAETHRRRTGRPFVTVSYAQSLDGSIAAEQGVHLPISGPESYTMTHALRAGHEAILVGIGTVLADDPRLTVRRVDGNDPQPVIVDSRLRLPPTARIFDSPPFPWVMTTTPADAGRQRALEAAGARVIRLPADSNGRIDLAAMLDTLGVLGVNSLMVEGGAEILTSVLTERLADFLIVTVAPRFVGGYHAVRNGAGPIHDRLPQLRSVYTDRLGDDVILCGEPAWEQADA